MDLRNNVDKGHVMPSEQGGPTLKTSYPYTLHNAKQVQDDAIKGVSVKYEVQSAVVIFCDLSNYQLIAKQYGDTMCTGIVETLFSQFDDIANDLSLQPLKTNGDQYIAVGFCSEFSLARTSLQHAHQYELFPVFQDVAHCAIEFAIKARNLVSSNTLLKSSSCQLRSGIAAGALLAGYSSRVSSGFDVWGSTVNKAAMLEQFTAPNTIAICEKTYHVLNPSSVKAGSPVTEGSAKLSESNNSTSNIGNKKPSEFWLLTNQVGPLALYNTQIKVKTASLNAYIC
ncbi:adenylate/guanylate cyclase domain-containing protein [Alteromonas sp. BL110]|uniref:adenylate/guanylate cyclase domain-containing protein n=1 Tax=Alteromonas sp. BL110 TaxID=1714845 RepID=UPI000E4BD7BE|nr:adenylate/guanylate cyclase domain-containing protein [Alteromonas sp. BL110]AXT40528.1 adenylate/guanylate cyclase domain-containing protein [Alteromonas sp. BL110]RKM79762.1 adenylate/guanylate cyclase domain-containing protein [Alteromonas sp. BL110]